MHLNISALSLENKEEEVEDCAQLLISDISGITELHWDSLQRLQDGRAAVGECRLAGRHVQDDKREDVLCAKEQLKHVELCGGKRNALGLGKIM